MDGMPDFASQPSRRSHNDACNYAPLPYMDDDGETIYETSMFLYFNIKIHLYLCLLVNETKTLQHFDCSRSIPATHGG